MSRNPPEFTNTYQAGRPNETHRSPRSIGSADYQVQEADNRLRDWVRWLDANLDIVSGAFDKLANFIVGEGLHIEPTVKDRKGNLISEVNDLIRNVLLDEDNPDCWSRDVCVNGEFHRGRLEWTAARQWLRDGEQIARAAPIRGSSPVPYQVQMIEPDFLPLRYNVIPTNQLTDNTIVQGVEKSPLGRALRYHFYKVFPGEPWLYVNVNSPDLYQPIDASEITFLKLARGRVLQTRGVPLIHSAIFRLDDIQEYETSHRIGARAASQIIGQLQKAVSTITETTPEQSGDGRIWDLQNGQILTDLLPGEELKWYKPEAPNPDATPFLDDQMRRVSSSFGLGWSTVSNKYDKSFSAARQEQSESWPNITVLRSWFIKQFVRPAMYEPALRAAMRAGMIKFPRKADPASYYSADIRGPARPTIDDLQQAKADSEIITNQTDSRQGRIRERGRNVRTINTEIKSDPLKSQQATPDPIPWNKEDDPNV